MKDRFERQINYMRISVTDRCNLRCFYCRGVQDFTFIPHQEILTYEEIMRLVKLALQLGIDRFRLTGGEPLVRKGLDSLIAGITGLPGVSDVSLTTNGLLLKDNLEKLKAAGLRRLNISLDSLDPERFRKITGVDGLKQVMDGLKRALTAGFDPVKINTVLLRGLNDREEVEKFIALAFELPVHVRFIELMDFSPVGGYFVSVPEILEKLRLKYRLEPVEVQAAGPARSHFRLAGMKGSFGFIAPYSHHFCGSCNRLRLAADGQLRTCLFSEKTYDLRTLIRHGASDEEILEVIRAALTEKPGSWQEARGAGRRNGLRSIGG
ncbi:MAG: GTP 3',8-cyclase MoaA [Candidatus Saccharicenans sp.]|uniref:GTP 3',8-cyclase MoaA n=1 Tax=Candidatus Saccharicenans sp. TaxID=2819258 RepID=UPI00404B0937